MQDSEKRFEEDIESYLLEKGGYAKDVSKSFDKENVINIKDLINYIKTTQSKKWERYVRIYQEKAEEQFLKRLNQEINLNGLLHVLRNGIEDRGVRLKVASFQPETSLNTEVIEDYKANKLSCIRQFYYSAQNKNSIDMVLALNGIPIVALELKNQIKGQSVDNAKRQFMYDRDKRELCFQFNKRFLVYFAVDLYEVWMTTKLNGEETFFLPFNQGTNGAGNVGGAGNPVNEDGYATSYLWEKVLTKDSLMELIQRYISLDGDNKTGRLLFPRYHQMDVVRKLSKDVKEKGTGQNYLIQHSAGSGKSNSIAWLSYRLSSLHDKNNKSVFTSVIVVTDRKVLDQQLQKTIAGFDHKEGIVETISEEKKSKDLRDAINDGKKIIITTLQKFPVIFNEVSAQKGKRFAIIVDEAHSSQTGDSAKKLRAALADTTEALKEFAEMEGKEEKELLDGEDFIVKELVSHGNHNNLSFFAFTATPKEKTIEMFGTKKEDGSVGPFHVYSMKQAIEEGFILDVLKNYMTYETSYKIAKATPDNPDIPTSQGVKAIRRFQTLHPHSLRQKTIIMIEQFRDVTKNKIGGRAKAMVVTASRLHAVRYYHEFKKYIEEKKYNDLDILVAFSGVVNDGGVEYEESKMNVTKKGDRISETQLKSEFHGEDFNVLIVAEKYQTGFDEPLVHTMFIDKKLSGVKAVQTLSRANRTHPGKNDTFILDFVNTVEDMKESFSPFFESTSLEESIDVNTIYDIKNKITNFNLYARKDIEDFLKIYYKKGKQNGKDLGKMTSLLKPIIERYMKLEEEEQYQFRVGIRSFNKWYSYITQIARMFDKELHQEYVFTSYLDKFIPKPDTEVVDIEEKLKLEYFKLKETFKGDATLNPNTVETVLKTPKVEIKAKPVEEDATLEEIINKINDKYQGKFEKEEIVIVETLYKSLKEDKKLKKSARTNDPKVFEQSIFPELFSKKALESYEKTNEAFKKLFENEEFYKVIMETVAEITYEELNKKQPKLKNDK